MNMKKVFLLIFFLMFSLSFGISNVLADCSECGSSDCESCGCVLDKDSNICVYSNYTSDSRSCGNGLITDIPVALPKIINIVYNIILIAVPVVLVIMGMLDLFKGITAQKDEEIKKGQQMLIKRLIAAAIVFFVFIIVKLVISFVADGNVRIIECAECFINNKCD